MDGNGYGSRKFLITSGSIVAVFVLALVGKMSSDVAIVLAAGIASYNYANYKIKELSDGT